jgi:hypothetical protein
MSVTGASFWLLASFLRLARAFVILTGVLRSKDACKWRECIGPLRRVKAQDDSGVFPLCRKLCAGGPAPAFRATPEMPSAAGGLLIFFDGNPYSSLAS